MNRAGFPEAICFESRDHGRLFQHGVVAFLCFGRRDVADGLEDTPIVEPVDSFEGGILDGLEGAPRPAPVDDLGLVEPVDGLCQRIVIAVADAADRGLDAGLGQALGVLDRDVLAAAIGVMDKAGSFDRPPLMESLLEGVEHEAGMHRAAGPPAGACPRAGGARPGDAAGKDVDDEGDVDEAGPGGDVCEVGDPEPVRRRGPERGIDPVERASGCLVAHRGADRLAPDRALQAHLPHQARHRAAGNREALAPQLPPQLRHAVDTEVLLEHAPHRDRQFGIP